MPPGPAYNWLCVASSVCDILSHSAQIRAAQLARTGRALEAESLSRKRKRDESYPNVMRAAPELEKNAVKLARATITQVAANVPIRERESVARQDTLATTTTLSDKSSIQLDRNVEKVGTPLITDHACLTL